MLKTFALYDGNLDDRPIGTLTYDADLKQFTIVVDDDIPAADLPLSLENRIKNGNRRIERDAAMSWVQARICPPGRHNIGEILRAHGLTEYDEFELLMVTMARCDKDALYLKALA